MSNRLIQGHNQNKMRKNLKPSDNKENKLIQTKLLLQQRSNNHSQSYQNIHKLSKTFQKSNTSRNTYSSNGLNYIMKSKQNLNVTNSLQHPFQSISQAQQNHNIERRNNQVNQVNQLNQVNHVNKSNQVNQMSSKSHRSSLSDIKSNFQQERLSNISKRKQQVQQQNKNQYQQYQKTIQQLKSNQTKTEDLLVSKQKIIIQKEISIQLLNKKQSIQINRLINSKDAQIIEIKTKFNQKLAQKGQQINQLKNYYQNQVIINLKLQVQQLKSQNIYQNNVQEILNNKQQKIITLQKQIMTSQKQIMTSQKQIKTLQTQITLFKQKIVTLQKQITLFKENNKLLQTKYQQKHLINQDIQTNNKQLLKQNQNLLQKIKLLQHLNSTIQINHTQINTQKHEQFERKISQINNKLQESFVEIQILHRQNISLSDEISEKQIISTNLKIQINQLNKKNDYLSQKTNNSQKSSSYSLQRIKNMQKILIEKETQINKLILQLKQSQSQYQKLNQTNQFNLMNQKLFKQTIKNLQNRIHHLQNDLQLISTHKKQGLHDIQTQLSILKKRQSLCNQKIIKLQQQRKHFIIELDKMQQQFIQKQKYIKLLQSKRQNIQIRAQQIKQNNWKLNASNAYLQKINTNLEEQLSKYKSIITQLQRNCDSFITQRQIAEKAAIDNHKQIIDNHKQISQLKIQLKLLTNKLNNEQDKIYNIQSCSQSFRTKLYNTQNSNDALKKSNQKLQNSNKTLLNDINNIKHKLKTQQQKVENTQKQQRLLQSQLKNIIIQKSYIQKKLENKSFIQEQLINLEGKLKSTEMKLKEYEFKLQIKIKEIQSNQKQLNAKDIKIKNLQSHILNLEEQISSFKTKYQRLQTQKSNIIQKNSSQKHKMNKVKQQILLNETQILKLTQQVSELQEYRTKYEKQSVQLRDLKQKYQKSRGILKKLQQKKWQQKQLISVNYRYNQQILDHCSSLLTNTKVQVQKHQSTIRHRRNSLNPPTHKQNLNSNVIDQLLKVKQDKYADTVYLKNKFNEIQELSQIGQTSRDRKCEQAFQNIQVKDNKTQRYMTK